MDYNPPKNFQTSYSDQFAKGGDGNAIKTVGNNYQTSGTFGKLDPTEVNPFVGSSSYALQYPNYGGMPKANVKDRSGF